MKNRNEQTTTPTNALEQNSTIFMAVEMSGKSWLLGIPTPLNDKISLHKFDAHDGASLIGKVMRIKQDVEKKICGQTKTMSVFEAGLRRFLVSPATLCGWN